MSRGETGCPAMFALLTKQKELKSKLHPINTGKQIGNQDIFLDYPFVLQSMVRS